MNVTIRFATPDDAAALVSIYSHYIRHTAITFEYEPPTAEEFAARIERVLMRYPYLVAQAGGEIIGYAYAGSYIERAACDWSVETSIYLRHDARARGVGAMLYDALACILARQGVVNLYASIAAADREDEYLSGESLRFHRRMGYTHVGTFEKCGYKFGRWYDLVWMKKIIGDHGDAMPPMKPVDEVREIVARECSIV
ncbi:MAG: N-acetyltransferase [Clostridia bacterium]|nr:N-acetyltransferase [Clostridia bacterium]